MPAASVALIVVDIQRGCVTDSTRHLLGPLEAFLDRNADAFELVVATQFVNSPGSPTRALLKREDMLSAPDTELCSFLHRTDIEVLEKNTYSAASETLRRMLREAGIESVCIAGIDTDMCVLATAIALFDEGIPARVFEDLCASTGGPEAHRAGLSVLRRALGATSVSSSAEFRPAAEQIG